MLKELAKKVELRTRVLEDIRKNESLLKALKTVEIAIEKGNKVLVFGNGGSATQASHFAAELVNKFYLTRRGMPSIALSADTAAVTSIANDFGFKYIFSKQVEALGKEGDIALGISTSGKSANVLEAFKTAGELNIRTIALSGSHTEILAGLNIDHIVTINSPDTPIVQEMHLFVLHFMAEMLEKRFFGK